MGFERGSNHGGWSTMTASSPAPYLRERYLIHEQVMVTAGHFTAVRTLASPPSHVCSRPAPRTRDPSAGSPSPLRLRTRPSFCPPPTSATRRPQACLRRSSPSRMSGCIPCAIAAQYPAEVRPPAHAHRPSRPAPHDHRRLRFTAPAPGGSAPDASTWRRDESGPLSSSTS